MTDTTPPTRMTPAERQEIRERITQPVAGVLDVSIMDTCRSLSTALGVSVNDRFRLLDDLDAADQQIVELESDLKLLHEEHDRLLEEMTEGDQ